MRLLTLETTCDETAAAVIADGLEVLGAVVASQDELHRRFGGVVPEIASRAHLERILPVIDETLTKAGVALDDIDAVAVAHTPGLAGSLLVGLVAAKTLCLALDVPLVTVDHLQAHIYACRLAFGPDVFPSIGLVVSGGHSNLYRCEGPLDFEWIGGTIDDAAGEAFDKVASMLGLPYPGGPSISKAAVDGDRAAHAFPRPFLKDKQRFDFSFSGLKTAVRYTLCGPGRQDFSSLELTNKQVADIAASFEEAVIDCLCEKSFLALEHFKMRSLCVGGGVAANRRLRERLAERAAECGAALYIAPFELCTDNAVMGAIALEKLAAGDTAPLDADILPGQVRPASR